MSFRPVAIALAVLAMPTIAAAQPAVSDGPRTIKELRDGKPDIRKPQLERPVMEKPRAVKPEIVKPQTVKPGVIKPQDKKPEVRRPDRDKGVPANMPSAQQIEKMLQAAPHKRIRPEERVHIREFKKRPDLRRIAPSIDIQSINFAFGSAEIPYSQFDKVENIAEAMKRILRRNSREVFLIEGHTDAVGSYASNQRLSEARAASLKRVLVNEFGLPRRALETVGYGEEFLLVPTQDESWQNRRVTLRRVTDQVVFD